MTTPEPAAVIEPKPKAVLESLYKSGKAPTNDGSAPFDLFPIGLTEEPGRALAELISREQVSISIETGLAYGLSTLWIMSATAGDHTAIDPDQTNGWKGAGVRAVHDAGLTDRFTLVEQDSRLALPRFIAKDRVFDFAFIDGAHRFEYVFADTCAMLRLVKPGGLIVLDDRWMPAIRAAADYAIKNMRAEPKRLDSHAAERRFVTLRAPSEPGQRPWDEFVEFSPAGVETPALVDQLFGVSPA